MEQSNESGKQSMDAAGKPVDGGKTLPKTEKPESGSRTVFHLALIVVALSALILSVSYSMNLRYSLSPGENGEVILDHWKGEVLEVSDGSGYMIRIHRREAKSLTGGKLWGDFEDTPIDAELHYANGVVFYRFLIEEFNDDIEAAIRNSKSIVFELQTDRNVTVHSVQENFNSVTHIMDDSEGSWDTVGVVFDGRFALDAGAWDGLSRMSTRFRQ